MAKGVRVRIIWKDRKGDTYNTTITVQGATDEKDARERAIKIWRKRPSVDNWAKVERVVMENG